MSHHRHRRPARSRSSQRTAIVAAIALSLCGLFAGAPSRAPKRCTCGRTAWSVAARPTASTATCRRSATGASSSRAPTAPGPSPTRSELIRKITITSAQLAEQDLGELHRQPGEGGGRARSHLHRRPVGGPGSRASDVFLYRAGLRLRSGTLSNGVFGDIGPAADANTCPFLTGGAIFSSQPLGVFGGSNLTGDWTLRITDLVAEDTGALRAAGVRVRRQLHDGAAATSPPPPPPPPPSATASSTAATRRQSTPAMRAHRTNCVPTGRSLRGEGHHEGLPDAAGHLPRRHPAISGGELGDGAVGQLLQLQQRQRRGRS